jgi:hypothetical protein
MEFEGKKYGVNGIEMNVVIEGRGPDLLLLHGFPDKFNAVVIDYLKADIGAKPRANSPPY